MIQVQLSPSTRVYRLGTNRIVIVPGSDGELRSYRPSENRGQLYIAKESDPYKEWRVRDVLPETGYVQCNVLNPDDHDHGATLFIRAGSITFMGDKYELSPVVDGYIMAIPFES